VFENSTFINLDFGDLKFADRSGFQLQVIGCTTLTSFLVANVTGGKYGLSPVAGMVCHWWQASMVLHVPCRMR